MGKFAPEETVLGAIGLADRFVCGFLPLAFLVRELDFAAFWAARFAGFAIARWTDFFLPIPSLRRQVSDT
ncbi:MAG: hypothetical protein MUF06_03075 [Pirellulaceae bacterium]|nr:hypothetical protein [Pirellulaceae bacterium]